MPYEQMWSCFRDARIATKPNEQGVLLPATPADVDRFLRWMRLNQREEETCRTTATRVAEVYAESAAAWPEPATAPRLTSDDRHSRAGTGGSSGAGGFGGGTAGLRGMPDLGAQTSRASGGPTGPGLAPSGGLGSAWRDELPGAGTGGAIGANQNLLPAGLGGGLGIGPANNDERDTWLQEDRDIWGTSDDGTTPWLIAG